MPPTRGIGRVPNNLDSTFRNDLIPYLSKQHYLISINAVYIYGIIYVSKGILP